MDKKQTATIINISNIRATCKECALREHCIPQGLDEADLGALDRVVKRRRKLKKGELLYRAGDPLRSLYAIFSGSIKTTGLMEDGRAQVTGFYLSGELLGIDAINSARHPCTAEALESSEVCEIPYPALEELAQHVPHLQHHLFQIMSREIARDEQMLLMLGRMSAEERLAACLLSFFRRQARLGLNGRDLKLSMLRQDLGDYLGLALETVSRLFSRFQEEGLIKVEGRHIQLRDPARLEALANGSAGSHHSRQN